SVGESAETETLRAAQAEKAVLDEVRERARRVVDAALAGYETASRPRGDATALEGMVAELASATSEICQRHAALRAQIDALNVDLTKRFSGLNDPDKKR